MKNNRGFSLPEMLVYIGISSIVMLVGASILILSNRLKSNVNTYVGIGEAINQIQATLKNEGAFRQTVLASANSSVFSCLIPIITASGANGQTGNCANPPNSGNFALYTDRQNPADPASLGTLVNVVGRPGVPTDGITMNGAYCNTYGQAPLIRCPFRIELSWKALCSTNPCPNPVVQISGALKVADPTALPKDFHLSNSAFKFSMIRQAFATQDTQFCKAVGGTLRPDGTCQQGYSKICPNGAFPIGFDANGNLLCRYLREVHCPHGQTFGGMDPGSGLMFCNSGCSLPAGPPVDPWGDPFTP